MDTVFYRKIAQIVLRESDGGIASDAAIRAEASKRIRKSDRRILRAYIAAYCDGIDAAWHENGVAHYSIKRERPDPEMTGDGLSKFDYEL